MKAFEEHWNGFNCAIDCASDTGEECVKCEKLASCFWRAALGWFYDKLGHSEEHEELKDLIEKELEETE